MSSMNVRSRDLTETGLLPSNSQAGQSTQAATMPHVEEGHNGGLNSGDVMKIQKGKKLLCRRENLHHHRPPAQRPHLLSTGSGRSISCEPETRFLSCSMSFIRIMSVTGSLPSA